MIIDQNLSQATEDLFNENTTSIGKFNENTKSLKLQIKHIERKIMRKVREFIKKIYNYFSHISYCENCQFSFMEV